MNSVEEFLARRPAYKREWLEDGMRSLGRVEEEVARLTEGDPARGQILRAAITIAALLDIPQAQVSPQIRDLVPQKNYGTA